MVGLIFNYPSRLVRIDWQVVNLLLHLNDSMLNWDSLALSDLLRVVIERYRLLSHLSCCSIGLLDALAK